MKDQSAMKIFKLDNLLYNPNAAFYTFQYMFQNYRQLFNKISFEYNK